MRGGLAALAPTRSDTGIRRMPPDLQLLIVGLALRRPPPAVATVHRQEPRNHGGAGSLITMSGWPRRCR